MAFGKLEGTFSCFYPACLKNPVHGDSEIDNIVMPLQEMWANLGAETLPGLPPSLLQKPCLSCET